MWNVPDCLSNYARACKTYPPVVSKLPLSCKLFILLIFTVWSFCGFLVTIVIAYHLACVELILWRYGVGSVYPVKMFLLLILLFSLMSHSLACLFIRWLLTVCEYCYKDLRISHGKKKLYRVCLSASFHPLYEMLLLKGQLIHKCDIEQSPSSAVALKGHRILNRPRSILNILKTPLYSIVSLADVYSPLIVMGM